MGDSCEHDWEYIMVVADVAPDGIRGRECRKCGRIENIGPFAEKGWYVVKDENADNLEPQN